MLIKNPSHTFKETGDTIVEVLISIAVVSLILGGAYVTTNRSLLATRDAEERSIALKLVESQVEQLKGLSKSNAAAIFGGATPMPFCISYNTSLPITASDDDCQVGASGGAPTGNVVYNMSITRAGDGHTFTITNQWTDVGGEITDNLRMIYRVYE